MGIGYFKKSMCIDADMVEHGMCMEPQYLGVTDCLEIPLMLTSASSTDSVFRVTP